MDRQRQRQIQIHIQIQRQIYNTDIISVTMVDGYTDFTLFSCDFYRLIEINTNTNTNDKDSVTLLYGHKDRRFSPRILMSGQRQIQIQRQILTLTQMQNTDKDRVTFLYGRIDITFSWVDTLPIHQS